MPISFCRPDALASSMLGDVRAGDQQHEPDDEHQREPPLARARDLPLDGGERPWSATLETSRSLLVWLVLAAWSCLPIRCTLAAAPIERHARLQTALDEHPACAAAFEPRIAGRRRHRADDAAGFDLVDVGHRRPDFGRNQPHHAGEERRRDADDCVR